jgi:hypothetical protein
MMLRRQKRTIRSLNLTTAPLSDSQPATLLPSLLVSLSDLYPCLEIFHDEVFQVLQPFIENGMSSG